MGYAAYASPPPNIFNNILEEQNFSIILNLFIAIFFSRLARIIETVRTKCIIGEARKVRGEKYDKLSLKIVQKALKWPLQYANFQKFSGGASPRIPLVSLLALKLLKINSAEKTTFEKVSKIGPSSLKKILNTPLT